MRVFFMYKICDKHLENLPKKKKNRKLRHQKIKNIKLKSFRESTIRL